MKVLVACEESGVVRDAFIRHGHDAISCDLQPSRSDFGPHIQGDARDVDMRGYDLLIAHPPCTDLTVAGARWFASKGRERIEEALELVRFFLDAPVPRIAVENPIGLISTHVYKPTQIIQPWMFGHGEQKATCLWLFGLWPLVPTNVVPGRLQRIWRMAPSPTRSRDRSETYTGIAEAMAQQWGTQ